MSDSQALSSPEPARAPFLDADVGYEPQTVTDLGIDERAGPVQAPSPSGLEQPARFPGGAAGATPGVLRVESAGEGGYRHVAIAGLVALVATGVSVLAVGWLMPAHKRDTYVRRTRRSEAPRPMPPHRSAGDHGRQGRHRSRRVRSDQIAPPAPNPVPSSVDTPVCAELCSSEPPPAMSEARPPRPASRTHGPVEEGGVEFGFEE
jgi:hypothetical protein